MKTILLYLAALLHLAFANAQYGSPESSDTSTTPTASISATAAAGAASETQTIQVGQGGFIFQPDTITADKGDVIRFVIHNTHSVARSALDNPCQPIGGAQNIWTGFPNDNTIFSLTINDTSPIWLYCAAPQHCQSGMAMVINPPVGGNNLSAYKLAASGSSNSGTPPSIAGGVFGVANDAGASATQASATGASATGASGNGAGSIVANFMMVGGAILGGLALLL